MDAKDKKNTLTQSKSSDDRPGLEVLRAELLNLWKAISTVDESERPPLRARYARTYEYYQELRKDLAPGRRP